MLDRLGHTLLIRPQEKAQVSYFLLLFFLIGSGMAIGRYSAEALFFKRYGIEYLPIIYMAHGLVLVFVTTFYAAFADKLAPEKLLLPLAGTLVVVLGCVWWLMDAAAWKHIYPGYFLLYKVAAEVFIVHCTLYLSRNFDLLQSKRLVPIIMSGWQIGSILGSLTLSFIAPRIGVQNMPMVWLSLVCLAMLLVFFYHHKFGVSPYHRGSGNSQNEVRHAIKQLSQGISFARKSVLLKTMSIALFFMVITFYVLSYSINRVYVSHFTDENSLTVFFGWLGAATGITAVALQVFVSNRLIRRFGVRFANLIFPSLTLGAFAGFLFLFSLPTAIAASVIRDSVMPAIRSPVRALFFGALPSYIQGRAHALSMGVILPLALLVAGLLLQLVQSSNNIGLFLWLGLFSSLAYWIANWFMNKGYLRSIIADLREKLFVPDGQFSAALQSDERQVLKLLTDAAHHDQPEIRFMAAKTLMDALPKIAPPIVLSIIDSLDAPLRDQLIARLVPLEPPELKNCLLNEIHNGAEHLKATAMLALFQLRVSEAQDLVAKALDSANPRMCSAGIFGALNYPVESMVATAKTRWREQIKSADTGQVLAALNLLARWPQPELLNDVLPHLKANDKRICMAAIGVLDQWPEALIPGFSTIFADLVGPIDPQIRAAAAQHLYRLSEAVRMDMARILIEDDHPDVRRAAARVLFPACDANEQIEIWLMNNQHSPKAQQAVLDIFHARHAHREAWERIARCFAARAAQFYAAYLALEKNFKLNDGLDLLRIVLSERTYQTLDLALYSAMQYEDKSTLGVIRAGVKVKDKRQWASTTEAVRYLEDKSLARSLSTLLETMSGDIPKEITRRWRFREATSVLEWVNEQGDPWLRQCAIVVN